MPIAKQKITPCLWFDTQAEEAAKFYTAIFENSRINKISRYTEAGRNVHGKEAGSVLTVEFELEGQTFTALNGGPHFKFSEAVSFQVMCDGQAEVDHFWQRLSDGGQEGQCGWLKDKFGVSWQVVPQVLPQMLTDADNAKARESHERADGHEEIRRGSAAARLYRPSVTLGEENVTIAAETKPAEREITITRVFDAPRVLVFKAWTDADQLAQWWGPKGFTNPVCEIDVRVGGAIRIHMRSPDGNVYPMKGEFREIVAPERIVFTNIAVDAAGNPIIEGLTTVTFAEHGGKTTMTLHTRGRAMVDYAVAYLQGMEMGWTGSIDKLETLLTRRGA